jgi:predicted dehydrogenase
MDDNSLMLLDFGNSLFAFAYGTVAGTVTVHFSPSYFGTRGTIIGLEYDGKPLDYPGRELANRWTDADKNYRLLPHVTGPHRDIEEMHIFEDIMQLVDWIREGIPSPVTPEHARHVIDIIESAYRSAQTGQTQELTTSFVSACSRETG